MSSDSLIALISFGIIFTLEFIAPFFKNYGNRIKHTLNNLGVAAINRIIILACITYFTLWLDRISQSFGGILSFIDSNVLRLSVAIILFDLWMYIWHRLNHEIYFLWRFHRMHHTDPQMDSTTAVRFHPIEIIFSYFLNFLFLTILGFDFTFLAIYNTVMVPVIIFHHSNIAFSEKSDNFLNYLIVMPRMHRVHHSEIMGETNSNYGTIFSFWDRLFKSFRVRDDIQSITYGIGTFKNPKWQHIGGMLFLPFK
ncbi:MAG: sterol desaturase family protein [Candidatus Omnitrophica bacterium]|nr:sterol desaturase family protein [Candidatus Omnitrophota bacterium]